MKKAKLLILSSRPFFWLGPVFIYILGVVSAGSIWEIQTIIGLTSVTFPLGLIISGLNDIADKDSDSKNPRKEEKFKVILKTQDDINLVYKATLLTTTFFVITLFILGKSLSVLLILLMVLLSYLYSFKPFRLKGKPILDSLSNALGFFLIFLLGFLISSNNLMSIFNIPKVIWAIFLGVLAIHAYTTLADLEIDKQFKDKTTGVVLGYKLTSIYCALIFGSIFFLVPWNLAVYLYLLICTGLCMLTFIHPTKKLILKAEGIMIQGFPILALYLFLFEYDFLTKILS